MLLEISFPNAKDKSLSNSFISLNLEIKCCILEDRHFPSHCDLFFNALIERVFVYRCILTTLNPDVPCKRFHPLGCEVHRGVVLELQVVLAGRVLPSVPPAVLLHGALGDWQNLPLQAVDRESELLLKISIT